MNSKIKLLVISIPLLFTIGCAQIGVNMGAPIFSRLVDNIGDSKNYKIVRDGIAGDIVLASAITELSPNNIRMLKECSYMYFTQGMIVEDTDVEYAKEMYLAGKSYGMRALKQNRQFRKGIEEGQPVHSLVKHLGKKYAPALCWTSLNSGMWVLLNLDDPGSFMEMADIVGMAKRSIELDDTYFHGVVKAFLGCYYAMVPKALDPECGPENSRKMFKEAKAIDNGSMLLYDLFEARFLASNINDEELYDKLLNKILTTDSGVLEGGFLLNELAKEKARYYLEHKASFF